MSRDPAATDIRHWVLRLAFVVTFGLTVETLRGAPLPLLAPVIALQLIAASRVPPGGRLVVMLLVVSAGASGLAYLVSIMTVGHAALYTIGVGLLYLWGFFLALNRKTALIGVMVITMTVVITGLASSSTGVAFGVMLSLLVSVIGAFFLVYLAYALLPGSAGSAQAPKRKPGAAAALPPALQALLATIVILPAHVYLNVDGVASTVVLLTMATMLRQTGIAQSTRYCAAFMCGNLLGAVLAAVAAFLIEVQNHGIVMLSVIAAGALFLSWLVSRGGPWTPVILPGYVSFTVLLGLVLSPLPLADGVAVIDRVALIVAGGVYAMAFVSLMIPTLPRLRRLAGLRVA